MKCAQRCNWNECQGKDWFALRDIYFCKYQVIWLIDKLELLLLGEWPISPIASSNGDLPGTGGPVRTEAYYVKPEEIAGDIEWRLERTGKDGKTLVEQIVKAKKDLGDEFDHEIKAVIDDLVSVSKDALNYICGVNRKTDKENRRRRQGYKAWLKQREYRAR